MAKTDVKLYATDTMGKSTTTTISDVNPEAPNSQLVQMGRLFNNLTQNTYGKTDRINTINCDTESGGGGKLTPTLTLSNSSCSVSDLRDSGTANLNQYLCSAVISTDSDGALFVKQSNLPVYQGVATAIDTRTADGAFVLIIYSVKASTGDIPTVPQTVTIYQAETDTYKAAEVTFTITA